MNRGITTKAIEATAGTAGVITAAAVIIPAAGILTAVGVVAGGLVTMAALETRKRVY